MPRQLPSQSWIPASTNNVRLFLQTPAVRSCATAAVPTQAHTPTDPRHFPPLAAMNPNKDPSAAPMRILPVDPSDIGTIRPRRPDRPWIDDWDLELNDSPSARNVAEAAARLRSGDLPVAFPTETVYGLGADATRGAAVRAVFAAKGRPADNPLIVHFASVEQLRRLLRSGSASDGGGGGGERDPIPPIYAPLLRAFWPGPLTILLPLPRALAPRERGLGGAAHVRRARPALADGARAAAPHGRAAGGAVGQRERAPEPDDGGARRRRPPGARGRVRAGRGRVRRRGREHRRRRAGRSACRAEARGRGGCAIEEVSRVGECAGRGA